jgi:hypothetical protein
MSSPIKSICGSLRKQVDVNGNTINITSSEWIVANTDISSLFHENVLPTIGSLRRNTTNHSPKSHIALERATRRASLGDVIRI